MKKKQIIGMLITGAVIIAVGFMGMLSNVVKDKLTQQTTDTADVMSSLMADNSVNLPSEDFVGVIDIVGEIGPSSSGNSSILSSSDSEYNHDLYMNYIDQMEESKNNKGILLNVNTPGGTVYESDELYLKLMEYKKNTGRPVWAYFGQEACSGGYYISMASDKIYANRNCWTGSIGVIVSLTNYKELYDKLGIKEIDITSGANKAMGSGGLDLTEEQRNILQGLVDEAYDQFVSVVSEGRGMDEASVKTLADGRIYTAKQAKENGLVDEVASYEEEKNAMIKQFDLDEDILFFTPDSSSVSSFFSSLMGAFKDVTPKSEAEIAKEIVDSKGKGVLKYYAE